MNIKPKLTIENLIQESKHFCEQQSGIPNKNLYGVTDGKAVGTYIEHRLIETISERYEYLSGSSANGIDFPGEEINTDIKVTSISQPQSSCPFKNVRQKIYGLGYNLLVFVYDKKDDLESQTASLDFVSCIFLNKERTADYQTTRMILQMLENGGNTDDITAYLLDRNIPADEMTLDKIAEEIMKTPPRLGYLTISNALQWRLHYRRIVTMGEDTDGLIKIVDRVAKL